MRNKRVLATVSALAIASLSLAACGGGDSGSGDGTLRLGLGEPKSLIPPNIGETEGGEIADHVYAGLYDYNPDGTLKQIIADGEPTTEDNKVWTIKLKDGFEFQNGEKITADTFVKSWNYAVYGPNANQSAGFLSSIEGYDDLQAEEGEDPKAEEMSGLKATDDLTLEVTLSDEFVGFPLMLGYSAFFPMADACMSDIDACNSKPIGNGMYQFDGKWEHKKSIKLTKWDGFKGDQPNIDKIEYKIYTGDAKCWPDFEAGNIDICPPSAEDYEAAKEKYGDELLEDETPNTWSLGFPVYDDVFKDKKVRQAFSLAIDRQSYIDGLFQGRYVVGTSWTPSMIPGYKADTCKYCNFDADKAKQLLDESSWPKDKKLELWVNSGPGEDYLKVLGDQLSTNLGIDYELKTLEWPDFLQKKTDHEITGPFLTGWVPDYPLNENYQRPLYGYGPDNNDFGYYNEEFESLLDEGNKQETVDDAILKYQEAEDILGEELPSTPVWVETTATKLGDNIDPDSFVRNPYGQYDYQKLAFK